MISAVMFVLLDTRCQRSAWRRELKTRCDARTSLPSRAVVSVRSRQTAGAKMPPSIGGGDRTRCFQHRQKGASLRSLSQTIVRFEWQLGLKLRSRGQILVAKCAEREEHRVFSLL